MIYVTGDCHGDFRRFSTKNFFEQLEMTREDYVIILGDFGGVWENEESKYEKRWLNWLENKSYTTLFIDGNHDNHPALAHYPVKSFMGGQVHEIRPHVLHLMRGEVFDIDGLKFFAFGGASSHDIRDGILDPVKDKQKIKEWNRDLSKLFRVNGVTWWKEELPSLNEMDNGWEKLEACHYKVDYVLTHSPAASVIALLGQGLYEQDHLTVYLETIRQQLQYKRWFAGHMHVNKAVNDKDILLYEQIIRIV